jgi:16S rRNA (guanine527-N7)-methyltransferase
MKYSPELQEKFDKYAEILRDWQTRMNLVSPGALDDIRRRHIDDSAQLADYLPKDALIVDMGSGAGFPAAVLAALGYDVVAIESVGKKTRFLEELKSRLNLPNLKVANDRVENYLKKTKDEKQKTIFTARAFAPLVKILGHISDARRSDAAAWLLKGANVRGEIAEAKEKFDFDCALFPSKTGDGFVAEIKNIRPKRRQIFHLQNPRQ